mmetsp:Transcript_110039/g.213034  ORF Transcript_110039/g.213034 Transcript_110039/m.213034 type:complete len:136 (+) Transcript_110039:1846-2253(+)
MVYTLARAKQFLGTSSALRSDAALFYLHSGPQLQTILGRALQEFCTALLATKDLSRKHLFTPVSHQCWTQACCEAILSTPVLYSASHDQRFVAKEFIYSSVESMLDKGLRSNSFNSNLMVPFCNDVLRQFSSPSP